MNYFVVAVLAVTVRLSSGTPRNIADDRIVGGEPACIENYPYQLAINCQGEFSCGAVLIKPNIALTAAHCTTDIKDFLPSVTVRAGSSLSVEGGQVSELHSFCQHPKYQEDSVPLDYDISVLFLKQPFVLGKFVKTIPLQPVNQEIRSGTMGTATGWGLTHPMTDPTVGLRVVQVPRVDHSECVEQYSRHGKKITSRMICFGFDEGGKSTCKGDSGGPIVVDGKLAGIVSWGHGRCAIPYAPGVYAKISYPEISSHIQGCIKEFNNKRFIF